MASDVNFSESRFLNLRDYLPLLLVVTVSMAAAGLVLDSPLYLVLTMAAVLFSVLAVKNSVLLAVMPFALITFIPADYVLSFQIPTPLGYLPPVIPAMAVAVSIALIKGISRGEMAIPNGKIYIAGLIFFSFYLLSWAVNFPALIGIKKITYMLLSSVGMIYFIENYARAATRVHIDRLIILIGIMVSIIGIVEYLFGFNPYQSYFRNFWWLQQSGQVWRIRSSVGNPLVLASYLMMLIVFIYPMLKQARVISSVALVLILTAVILTFSRTAYFAIVVTALLFVGLEEQKMKNIMILGFGLLLSLFVAVKLFGVYGIEELVSDRLLFEAQGSSLTYRLEAWAVTFDIASIRDLLFGVGVANVSDLITEKALLPIRTFDNAFLDIYWESGIFSTIAFILFLVSPCLVGANEPMRKQRIMICTVFIIFSLSFATYYFKAAWLTYWFLQSMLLLEDDRRNKKVVLNTAVFKGTT